MSIRSAAAILALASLKSDPAGPSTLAQLSQLINWRNMAKRELPRTELVGTPGPWVSVSECPPRQAFYHPDEQSANRGVKRLDDSGCGGRGCRGSHAEGQPAQHWMMPLED